MIRSLSYKVNDRSPSLQVSLRYEDGTFVDLTGASVNFVMTPQGQQTPLINNPCVVVDVPSSQVRYDWRIGDTSTLGTFQAEFQVVYPGGKQQTVPSHDYFYITIEPRLGE